MWRRGVACVVLAVYHHLLIEFCTVDQETVQTLARKNLNLITDNYYDDAVNSLL